MMDTNSVKSNLLLDRYTKINDFIVLGEGKFLSYITKLKDAAGIIKSNKRSNYSYKSLYIACSRPNYIISRTQIIRFFVRCINKRWEVINIENCLGLFPSANVVYIDIDAFPPEYIANTVFRIPFHGTEVYLKETVFPILDEKYFCCELPGSGYLSIGKNYNVSIGCQSLIENLVQTKFISDISMWSDIIRCISNDVIHNDIKPANIVVRSNRVKLIDWSYRTNQGVVRTNDAYYNKPYNNDVEALSKLLCLLYGGYSDKQEIGVVRMLLTNSNQLVFTKYGNLRIIYRRGMGKLFLRHLYETIESPNTLTEIINLYPEKMICGQYLCMRIGCGCILSSMEIELLDSDQCIDDIKTRVEEVVQNTGKYNSKSRKELISRFHESVLYVEDTMNKGVID